MKDMVRKTFPIKASFNFQYYTMETGFVYIKTECVGSDDYYYTKKNKKQRHEPLSDERRRRISFVKILNDRIHTTNIFSV